MVDELRWVSDSPDGMGYLLQEGLHRQVPPVVMLHGKSGDEKGMWIFKSILPGDGLVLAPRGFYPLDGGGYSWVPELESKPTTISSYIPAAETLEGLVMDLCQRFDIREDQLALIGFSQGAALAFSAAALGVLKPTALVSLSGFLPEGDIRNLAGLPVFWGHGLRDEQVPAERARMDVKRLRRVGAEVNYCEADVGHKLGLGCAQGLREWLMRWISPTYSDDGL